MDLDRVTDDQGVDLGAAPRTVYHNPRTNQTRVEQHGGWTTVHAASQMEKELNGFSSWEVMWAANRKKAATATRYVGYTIVVGTAVTFTGPVGLAAAAYAIFDVGSDIAGEFDPNWNLAHKGYAHYFGEENAETARFWTGLGIGALGSLGSSVGRGSGSTVVRGAESIGAKALPEASHLPGGGTPGMKPSQAQGIIDDVLTTELKGVKMSATPKYDPHLTTAGLSTPPNLGGPSIAVGPSAAHFGRATIRSTLIHEELHFRLWKKKLFGPHHPAFDDYIRNVINRFERMMGIK